MTLFANFSVGGENIPVVLLFYEGHGESYVVFCNSDSDSSLFADDSLDGYLDYYDFDVYSTGNILPIIEAVKAKLIEADWIWQVSRSSPDIIDKETGYYHKTLCFAKERK